MQNEKLLLPKAYKRFTPEPIETDSALDTVLSMATDSLKAGRPPTYPETAQGLADFKENVIGYFNFLKQNNESEKTDKKLIPDVEGLCVFCGITRVTLLSYEKSRGSEWQTFIRQAKEAITACKKQLIFNQQIPPVIGIFDLTNNSGYINSSEFKLQAQTDEKQARIEHITAELDTAGLVWDESAQEYIPKSEGGE